MRISTGLLMLAWHTMPREGEGEAMKRREELAGDGMVVVRYDSEEADGQVETKAAWDEAEKDAKAGKKICLTDLIGMSERVHLQAVDRQPRGEARLAAMLDKAKANEEGEIQL
jgi:hypothetical protein